MILEGVIVAFILGFVSHHAVFIHGEWHLHAPRVLATYATALFLLFSCQLYPGPRDLHLAPVRTALFAASYLSSLFISIGTYRIFFHPLVEFPGPRLAALTKLWHVWKCRDSRNYRVLETWRQQYGTFVRTGPNEITVFHPSVYEVLDGPKNRSKRGDWHDIIYPDVSPIFTRDKVIHHDRRKMWDNALTSGSMSQYYSRMVKQIEKFDNIIFKSGSQPISVNEMIQSLLINSIGDLGFGQDFSKPGNMNYIDISRWMRSSLSLLGPFGSCIWICRLVLACSPRVWRIKDWYNMRAFADSCTEARKMTLQKDEECTDLVSFFLQTFQQRQGEPGWHSLSGDAVTILVAGSDTTASSLIFLLYFLVQHPEHAVKIRDELEGIDQTDVNVLASLEHLNGTINESMRLLPVILSFGERITPPEGLMIEGTFIPGNTKIVTPRYSISRLESAFEDPHSFIPERWYSKPELIKDKRAFAPFGIGRTSCVGKKLSLTMIRLFTATILSKYDIKTAPNTGNGEAVERDLRDQLVAKAGELVLIFNRRTNRE